MSNNQPILSQESKPLKILYLVTHSEWAGAQVYIFDLAAYFSQKNWEITITAGQDQQGELIKRLKKLNVSIYYLPHLKRRINFYHDSSDYYK